MYCLRELERRDLSAINKWRNDPELIALLGAPFRYINLDVDIKWYEAYMGNRGNAVRCAITEDGSDEILGLVSLVAVDHMNQIAEFHIMIGDKANHGRGIGTFAVNAMLEHAFSNMNLQRVELSVVENNVRAQRLYEKCGFIYEGRKRKARYKNGKFVDLLMYSILKSEFNKIGFVGGVQRLLPNWSINRITERIEIDSIIRYCDKAFGEPVAESTIYSDLLEKIYQRAIFISAFSMYDAKPIGYCAFYANDPESRDAYITLIAVRPEYQGQHIGKRLIEEVSSIALDRKMRTCTLEVMKNNLPAREFYRKNGFVFLRERDKSFLLTKELRPVRGDKNEYIRKESDFASD